MTPLELRARRAGAGGDRATAHFAERIGAFVLNSDAPGVHRWEVIAVWMDALRGPAFVIH
jgi:hypothetical protein